MQKIILSFASLYGLLGVVLGAFGAHALREKLAPEQLAVWQTGVQYQFYHAFALLLVGLLAFQMPSKLLSAAGVCFMVGILLFSGSLYLLSTRELTGLGESARILGPVTPLGGLMHIIGWLLLGLAVLARNFSSNPPQTP